MGANATPVAALSRATANQVIAANSTVAFDFGTPDNIYLPNFAKPGDRILVMLTAVRAAGTTSTLQLVVQDADGAATAIGTPATATVVGSNAVVAAADAGNSTRFVSLVVKAGRPWLKVSLTHAGGGTDSFNTVCTVFALPAGI